MTQEAQRIAIAIACGWKSSTVSWISPNGVYWASQVGERNIPMDEVIPWYTTDLNAMYEAEETLMGNDREDYWDILASMVPDNKGMFPICHAKASQRAEAFLRVLNIWKDS